MAAVNFIVLLSVQMAAIAAIGAMGGKWAMKGIRLLLIGCAVLLKIVIIMSCGDTVNHVDEDKDINVSEDNGSNVGKEEGNAGVFEPATEIKLSCTLDTRTLKAANIYKLVGGAVIVPAGEVLTIEPGTLIKGAHSPRAWLEIEVGGKIIAEGTPTRPIIFTSAKPKDARAAGDWGGLIIKGDSVGHFKPNGNRNDSSGVLRYVRVEYAGSAYGDGHLNGISFEHVGAGTVVEYIQVFEALDDAIEFYGGNVNLQHVVVTGYRDDGIDWTQGYTGTIQYLICQKTAGFSNRGIEGDNNPDGANLQPRSNPKIYSATIIGMNNEGILLRNGSAATIKNCIVVNCKGAGFMVDATSANNSMAVDAMKITNNIFFNNQPNLDNTVGFKTNAAKIADVATTLIIEPQLNDIANWDWKPRVGSPALDAANSDLLVSDFIGALGAKDWTIGWIHR